MKKKYKIEKVKNKLIWLAVTLIATSFFTIANSTALIGLFVGLISRMYSGHIISLTFGILVGITIQEMLRGLEW